MFKSFSFAVLSAALFVLPAAAQNAPLPGKGYLVMDQAGQDQKVVKQRPASMTGAATSISFDIGAKIRDKGIEVLSPAFAEGVVVNTLVQTDAYNLSVRNDGFTYKYDSLSGLGFTVTPRVDLTLTIEIFAPDGKSLLRKAYKREKFDAGAYVATFKPKEKVIGAFEACVMDIYKEALKDLQANSQTTPVNDINVVPPVVEEVPVDGASASASTSE